MINVTEETYGLYSEGSKNWKYWFPILPSFDLRTIYPQYADFDPVFPLNNVDQSINANKNRDISFYRIHPDYFPSSYIKFTNFMSLSVPNPPIDTNNDTLATLLALQLATSGGLTGTLGGLGALGIYLSLGWVNNKITLFFRFGYSVSNQLKIQSYGRVVRQKTPLVDFTYYTEKDVYLTFKYIPNYNFSTRKSLVSSCLYDVKNSKLEINLSQRVPYLKYLTIYKLKVLFNNNGDKQIFKNTELEFNKDQIESVTSTKIVIKNFTSEFQKIEPELAKELLNVNFVNYIYGNAVCEFSFEGDIWNNIYLNNIMLLSGSSYFYKGEKDIYSLSQYVKPSPENLYTDGLDINYDILDKKAVFIPQMNCWMYNTDNVLRDFVLTPRDYAVILDGKAAKAFKFEGYERFIRNNNPEYLKALYDPEEYFKSYDFSESRGLRNIFYQTQRYVRATTTEDDLKMQDTTEYTTYNHVSYNNYYRYYGNRFVNKYTSNLAIDITSYLNIEIQSSDVLDIISKNNDAKDLDIEKIGEFPVFPSSIWSIYDFTETILFDQSTIIHYEDKTFKEPIRGLYNRNGSSVINTTETRHLFECVDPILNNEFNCWSISTKYIDGGNTKNIYKDKSISFTKTEKYLEIDLRNIVNGIFMLGYYDNRLFSHESALLYNKSVKEPSNPYFSNNMLLADLKRDNLKIMPNKLTRWCLLARIFNAIETYNKVYELCRPQGIPQESEFDFIYLNIRGFVLDKSNNEKTYKQKALRIAKLVIPKLDDICDYKSNNAKTCKYSVKVFVEDFTEDDYNLIASINYDLNMYVTFKQPDDSITDAHIAVINNDVKDTEKEGESKKTESNTDYTLDEIFDEDDYFYKQYIPQFKQFHYLFISELQGLGVAGEGHSYPFPVNVIQKNAFILEGDNKDISLSSFNRFLMEGKTAMPMKYTTYRAGYSFSSFYDPVLNSNYVIYQTPSSNYISVYVTDIEFGKQQSHFKMYDASFFRTSDKLEKIEGEFLYGVDVVPDSSSEFDFNYIYYNDNQFVSSGIPTTKQGAINSEFFEAFKIENTEQNTFINLDGEPIFPSYQYTTSFFNVGEMTDNINSVSAYSGDVKTYIYGKKSGLISSQGEIEACISDSGKIFFLYERIIKDFYVKNGPRLNSSSNNTEWPIDTGIFMIASELGQDAFISDNQDGFVKLPVFIIPSAKLKCTLSIGANIFVFYEGMTSYMPDSKYIGMFTMNINQILKNYTEMFKYGSDEKINAYFRMTNLKNDEWQAPPVSYNFNEATQDAYSDSVVKIMGKRIVSDTQFNVTGYLDVITVSFDIGNMFLLYTDGKGIKVLTGGPRGALWRGNEDFYLSESGNSGVLCDGNLYYIDSNGINVIEYGPGYMAKVANLGTNKQNDEEILKVLNQRKPEVKSANIYSGDVPPQRMKIHTSESGKTRLYFMTSDGFLRTIETTNKSLWKISDNL
jgi:hypothetical protein